MRALKITAEVGADHHVVLDLPEAVTPGPAEIIVLVRDEPQAGGKKDLDDVFRLIKAYRGVRSLEDIQVQVGKEREGWGE